MQKCWENDPADRPDAQMVLAMFEGVTLQKVDGAAQYLTIGPSQ
jgi:hypothetical protein